MDTHWEVGYPNGLIKIIDYFRMKYFQYDIFDQVIDKYVKKYCRSKGKVICSLGSGTGRHEVELAKKGYTVFGLERNEESVKISREYINSSGVDVKILQCDFLNEEEVDKAMKTIGKVDVVALLLIPISIQDYSVAANNLAKWLKAGGIFLADNFGYVESIDSDRIHIESNIEVAESPDKKDYAVRMNYYEYKNNIVNWDAVYLYYKDNKLVMERDHDILDVYPEADYPDCLQLNQEIYEILPNYRVVECDKCLAPPHLYEYIIGRRKICE